MDDEDALVGDANTGWTRANAILVCKAASAIDCYVERPCRTLEECVAVKKASPQVPFIIDESANDLHSLLEAWKLGSADMVNIKISKFGGLTKAKKVMVH